MALYIVVTGFRRPSKKNKNKTNKTCLREKENRKEEKA